jgi:hypothetical protein
MIAALVPINIWINRFFPKKYMDALTAEGGEGDDEQYNLH